VCLRLPSSSPIPTRRTVPASICYSKDSDRARASRCQLVSGPSAGTRDPARVIQVALPPPQEHPVLIRQPGVCTTACDRRGACARIVAGDVPEGSEQAPGRWWTSGEWSRARSTWRFLGTCAEMRAFPEITESNAISSASSTSSTPLWARGGGGAVDAANAEAGPARGDGCAAWLPTTRPSTACISRRTPRLSVASSRCLVREPSVRHHRDLRGLRRSTRSHHNVKIKDARRGWKI